MRISYYTRHSRPTTARWSSFRISKKVEVPVVQQHREYSHIIHRNTHDAKFIKPFELDLEREFARRYEPHSDIDKRDLISLDPSYTRFKIAFELVCTENYKKSKAKYNDQIVKEIENLILYQSKAIDAASFLRAMSYTTLWPPYHSECELESTSREFYKLLPSEKNRLHYIMNNNIC